MSKHYFSGLYTDHLPDLRLSRRLEHTLTEMLSSGTAIVNRATKSNSSKTGFYRMLSNDRIDHEAILEGSYRLCSGAVDASHVLCIQDTTEFNYQGIKRKLTDLDADIGPTGVKAVAGFFCHPMLVADADSHRVFGLSSVLIYNRSWDRKNKFERKYSSLPITEKESYRWVKSCELSQGVLPPQVVKTIIGDRESDLYEEFASVPDEHTHLLVRSRSDRNLSDSTKLYETLDAAPIKDQITVQVSSNKKRTARTAVLDISFCGISICAPQNYKGAKESVDLYAILVKEQPESVPKTEKPILWRLLTTHTVESPQQAKACIEWYKKRWLIEELFRVIKTKGFNIEASQLGSGAGLKKLLAMTLMVGVKIMQLKLALNDTPLPAQDLFSSQELEYLKLLQNTVEGPTQKQKNPYSENTIAWAAWTIARLAGWTSYQGPPGYITIKAGYDIFNNQIKGYNLSRIKDV